MSSESLVTIDMLEQIATLVWAQSGNPQMAERIAGAKLVSELWQRFSGQQEIDSLRSETVLKICQYVKDHPKATKEQLTSEIGKCIAEFASKVEHM